MPNASKGDDSDGSAGSAGVDGGGDGKRGGSWKGEEGMVRLAEAFFQATTKESVDNEDILPQEDSDECALSVFGIFSACFPEAVGPGGAGANNKRMRLHFNKIGYQLYGKEQSRRVPAVRAKPGNPGYGFRRARWRDTVDDQEDSKHCEEVLREVKCSEQRIVEVKEKIQDICREWDNVRRPSRPAGPGRPRRPDEASPMFTAMPTPLLLLAESAESSEKARRKWKPMASLDPPADSIDFKSLADRGEGEFDRAGGCLVRREKGSAENPSFEGEGGKGWKRGRGESGDALGEHESLTKAARMLTPDRGGRQSKEWSFKQSPQCNKNAMASDRTVPSLVLLPPLKLTDPSFPKTDATLPPFTKVHNPVRIEFKALEMLANASSRVESQEGSRV